MALPDPDTFVTLPVQQRGWLLLADLSPGGPNGKDSRVGSVVDRLWSPYATSGRPSVDHHTFRQKAEEAYGWLAREGLTMLDASQRGDNWILPTEEGLQALKAADPLRDLEARKLLTLPLHARLSPARTAFESGDFEGAVFKAMRAVENAVKEASGITERMQPKALMTRAFKADEGPLADTAQETAEQEGVMYLFMGAIAALRNPVGHREDLHEDPAEPAKIVIFADLLLDIVDRAVARGAAS